MKGNANAKEWRATKITSFNRMIDLKSSERELENALFSGDLWV
jgi:hypothetical protein